MTVLSPCDSLQCELLTQKALLEESGPVYIRYGREPRPNFTDPKQKIEIGKAQIFREGKDISLIATGHLLWEALEASKRLQKQNIEAEVINIHTIKPIDRQAIIRTAMKTGRVLCAEEHQITGGLGSAVAEVLSSEHPVPMTFVGMNDSFGESGQAHELMIKYGLSAENIFNKAMQLIQH